MIQMSYKTFRHCLMRGYSRLLQRDRAPSARMIKGKAMNSIVTISRQLQDVIVKFRKETPTAGKPHISVHGIMSRKTKAAIWKVLSDK